MLHMSELEGVLAERVIERVHHCVCVTIPAAWQHCAVADRYLTLSNDEIISWFDIHRTVRHTEGHRQHRPTNGLHTYPTDTQSLSRLSHTDTRSLSPNSHPTSTQLRNDHNNHARHT